MGDEVKPTDKPNTGTIRVALNRLRRCPGEIPDQDVPTNAVTETAPQSESVEAPGPNHE